MTDSYIDGVSKRYIELYEAITGEGFLPADTTDLHARIESNVSAYLKL